jgi:gluconate 2-dehydrogenase gamma chain
MSMAEWEVVELSAGGDERLFFTEHEWRTIEAATARIIPTDRDPGAREARVVRFIDRYLSGIDYVYAAADGRGFLRLGGKQADAWRERIAELQRTYRDGVRTLDELAGGSFADLDEGSQDAVLAQLSDGRTGEAAYGTVQIFLFDDGLDFFSALATHTRQGFYADPVYGGNAGFAGWRTIGFPGPESLADTTDGTYDQRAWFVQDSDWGDLIPHLEGR